MSRVCASCGKEDHVEASIRCGYCGANDWAEEKKRGLGGRSVCLIAAAVATAVSAYWVVTSNEVDWGEVVVVFIVVFVLSLPLTLKVGLEWIRWVNNS